MYYNSYILPIIDYGIILWQSASKRKLIQVANIQKRNARMILDTLWDHPSTPLVNELNWLPLQSCITYHVTLLVFKIHTALAPESRCHLAQPKKKSYYSNLTLQSLSTPIWNNILKHMKSAKNVNTFKSMLNKHLFYTN